MNEVQRRLGKILSTADLKSLYTLYDYLALPAEVICLLVSWCVEEFARKYGPGRKPRMSQIQKEGFVWQRLGVDTAQAAEAHLKKQALYRTREGEILRLLDLPPRPLVEKERKKVAAWTDMGFDDAVLRLAYEKTVYKKQKMDWDYMNGILLRLAQEEPAHPGGDRGGGRPPPEHGPARPPCRPTRPARGGRPPGAGGSGADAGIPAPAEREKEGGKPWDTKPAVLRRATKRLEERRKAREERQERLRAEIYAQLPRVAEIDKELKGTIYQIIAASLRSGRDPVPAIGVIRDKNLDLQAEKAELLTDHGYPADALDDAPPAPGAATPAGWGPVCAPA